MNNSFAIDIEIFDLRYFMFFIGLALNRYTEWDDEYSWTKNELVIGLFFGTISFSYKKDYQPVDQNEQGEE